MFVYVTFKKYVFSMVSKKIQQPPLLPQSLSLEPNSSKFMSDEVHAVQVKPNAMQCLVIHRIGTHACKDANFWSLKDFMHKQVSSWRARCIDQVILLAF